MKITRLYTGDDGESHFENVDLVLDEDSGVPGILSKAMKTNTSYFLETKEGTILDWHNAPRRQYVVWLGDVEIEVGDGTTYCFKKGDILLAEDTTGRGHITRNLSQEPLISVMIALD